MKIILLKDVVKIGRAGETKDVPLGFARNFLLAKGLACLTDDLRAAELLENQKERKQQSDLKHQEEQKRAEELNGKKFIFQAKADKNGHLYGSITPKEIAKRLGISENLITTYFKQIGIFPLVINLVGGFQAKVEIEITNSQ